MIELRPYAGLGGGHHGWLDTRHHFSFADYQDPHRVHWGRIRVWNDDEITANAGFPAHPHSDMEIITYVREGAITHQDSLGNTGRTEAGDVQVMSAGTGIRHSEWNAEPGVTRIFQIWIIPDARGGAPRWGAKPFPRGDRSGRFVTLASGPVAAPDTLAIRADASVLGATLASGQTAEYRLAPGRHAYMVPSQGVVDVNGTRVGPRDGAAITDEPVLRVTALEDAEIVLVDAAQLPNA